MTNKIIELNQGFPSEKCPLREYCADSEERSSDIKICQGIKRGYTECSEYKKYLKKLYDQTAAS